MCNDWERPRPCNVLAVFAVFCLSLKFVHELYSVDIFILELPFMFVINDLQPKVIENMTFLLETTYLLGSLWVQTS